jgi:hypothetical protein
MAAAFVLICSNLMAAGARWDTGWPMLLAFPRAYLLVALWLMFLSAFRFPEVNRRAIAVGFGLAVVAAGLTTARELERWTRDETDGAVIADPSQKYMAMFPTTGPGGVIYSSFFEGAPQHTSSYFGKGLVSESRGKISGCCLNGVPFSFPGATEPAAGRDAIVALRADGLATVVVERSASDTDWRELFRRPSIVHDPAVSADATRIAFSEWADGRYRISEWRREDGSIRTLVSGDGDYRYPAYSPSGRWFFYAENVTGEWNVVALPGGNAPRRVLTTSEANDLMPVVSADERTLYFASDRRRGYRYTAIYKMPLR